MIKFECMQGARHPSLAPNTSACICRLDGRALRCGSVAQPTQHVYPISPYASLFVIPSPVAVLPLVFGPPSPPQVLTRAVCMTRADEDAQLLMNLQILTPPPLVLRRREKVRERKANCRTKKTCRAPNHRSRCCNQEGGTHGVGKFSFPFASSQTDHVRI